MMSVSKAIALLLALLTPGFALAQNASTAPTGNYNPAYQVPISDPSRLTSEQLFREIGQQEKNFGQQIQAISLQIAAIIKAADEARGGLGKMSSEFDKKLEQLGKLQAALSLVQATRFDERFVSVGLQFRERDERIAQLAAGTKTAMDLALNAQREQSLTQYTNIAAAINEIKQTFTKQIDAQRDLQQSSAKSLEDKISGVKDSVTMMDGHSHGAGDSIAVMISGVGLLIAFGAFALSYQGRQQSAANAQAAAGQRV
jgi:hypothetical protein